MTLEKNNKNIIYFILLPLIFLFFTVSYFYTSSNIPIDGDGGFHASIVEKTAKQGKLITKHPYVLVDQNTHLPLFYPKLFYSAMAVFYTFVGERIYLYIVAFFGLLTGLFAFLISRNLSKSPVIASISTIVVLSSYGLVTNSVDMFRMETMTLLLAVSSIYCLIKYTTDKKSPWLIIATILFGACLATKQQAYIYVPIFILIILNKYKKTLFTKIKLIFLFFLTSLLIAAPALIEEFKSTGTLFYPGVPLLSPIEQRIANTTGVELYSVGKGWKKYAIGSDRGTYLKSEFSKFENHLAFLNPFNTGYENNFIYLSNILLIFGSLILIKTKNYFLIFFLALQQILLYIFPLERYYVLSQILSSLIIGLGVGFNLNTGRRNVNIYFGILCTLVMVASISSFFPLVRNSLRIPDASYGQPVFGRLNAEIEAGKWIEENTPEDSVVITSRAYLDSYYTQRDSLWLNQIGGENIYEAFLSNDVNSIANIANFYGNTYIMIHHFWIIDAEVEGRWVSFIEKKTSDLIAENTNLFTRVFSNNLIDVYHVTKN